MYRAIQTYIIVCAIVLFVCFPACVDNNHSVHKERSACFACSRDSNGFGSSQFSLLIWIQSGCGHFLNDRLRCGKAFRSGIDSSVGLDVVHRSGYVFGDICDSLYELLRRLRSLTTRLQNSWNSLVDGSSHPIHIVFNHVRRFPCCPIKIANNVLSCCNCTLHAPVNIFDGLLCALHNQWHRFSNSTSCVSDSVDSLLTRIQNLGNCLLCGTVDLFRSTRNVGYGFIELRSLLCAKNFAFQLAQFGSDFAFNLSNRRHRHLHTALHDSRNLSLSTNEFWHDGIVCMLSGIYNFWYSLVYDRLQFSASINYFGHNLLVQGLVHILYSMNRAGSRLGNLDSALDTKLDHLS
mmetsp:Transcript_15570/g.39196  ORF Transcript_15570/g.39196 Transcript_15570/m.39196 type:complete len:349 (-) Transcript_15570:1014-2060(-)